MTQFVRLVIALSAPVQASLNLAFLIWRNIFHDVFQEFLKSGTVHNVTNMFFTLYCITIQILVQVIVYIYDDLSDRIMICPFHEIFRKARILLSCTSHKNDAEVLFFTSGPGSGRTIVDTNSASDALIGISFNLSVDHLQCSDRTLLTVFHTLLAPDTAVPVILRFCLAHDSKIIQAHMSAVVRTSGKRDLYMMVIREDGFVNLLCEFLGVIAAKRAQSLSRTCNDISGP